MVMFLLSGCVADSPPPPDPRTAVEQALDALADQTAVAYQVSAVPSGGLPPDPRLGTGPQTPLARLTVTRNGLAQGVLPIRGEQVGIVRVGGSVFLRAHADYWREQGMPAERAGEYGARWVRVDGGVPLLDPRLLDPAAVARTLRERLPAQARPVRATLPDGTAVFEVNGLRVTAVAPHRVADVAPELLGQPVEDSFGAGVISVDGLSGGGLADLRSSLDGAISGLGQPFVAGPVVAASVTANELSCDPDGLCTDTVQVRHQLVGGASDTGVRLVLTAAVNSADLGTRSCVQEVVVAVNEPAAIVCAVRFELPRKAGYTRVIAQPAVTAEPVAIVDIDRLRREVATELG